MKRFRAPRFMRQKVMFLLILATSLAISSCGTVKKSQEPSNSFSAAFENSSIAYAYRSKLYMHDYSSNWDLDGDGVLDKIYFVGNGGAHLQFILTIELSSTQTKQTFDWIYNDSPLYAEFESIDKTAPGFSVKDFNADGNTDLFVYSSAEEDALVARGLTMHALVIRFDSESKKLVAEDFYQYE